MTKIALLSPYYGSLPDCFPFYVKSLANNPNIHVYMFTDCSYEGDVPENLHFIKSNIQHFKRLVKDKLDVDAIINKGYKLCDFRPAFGVIFEDYIIGYDYWAMGDIDVIYGQLLDNFPENWRSFDVVSMVPEWLSGSLCIFRNVENINKLYMSSSSWETVFSSEKHYAFDECNCLYERLRQGENILEIDELQSFTYLVKNAAKNGDLKVWFKRQLVKEKIFANNDHIQMLDGRLYRKDRQELTYYHLVSEKRHDRFVLPKWNHIPNEYFIVPHGFFSSDDFWHSQLTFYRLYVLLRSFILDTKQLLKRVRRKLRIL
ncbi:DUF6625 family protein [uncultured Amphritea sp.]|uniref:DUF6625 family protein n=1 Tax=uncultured Amphritea sp. TaxID=981605 RepID=UPI002618BC4C|nr:DUF6625 family protein [uncultured Amphritea sp.]